MGKKVFIVPGCSKFGEINVSRISTLIYKNSDWPSNIITSAIFILGEKLQIKWLEDFEEIVQSQERKQESYLLECILEVLLESGQPLLIKLKRNYTPDEVIYKIEELEQENQAFSREMSYLRRKVSRRLGEVGESLSPVANFCLWLDHASQILAARNAGLTDPLMEENIYCPISQRERECIERILNYIRELGWEKISEGEKEEAILCLCQHFYSLGEWGTASELLTDAMNSHIRDPLIYYNYFILGLSVGEFDSAIEGYRVAIKEMPVLSLAPSDRYQITEIVQHSRIETTCKGFDAYTKKPIFIKVLQNPPLSIREAVQDSTKLRHERLIQVYNFHEINPLRPCLITEYVDGVTLEQYIKKNGPLKPNHCLEIALQIVGSLAYAHDQKKIHGNISPSKLYWQNDSVKVGNFGLFPFTNWSQPISRNELTEVFYMAPELLSSNEMPTTRCDAYSLGMVIYYMLKGCHPQPMTAEGIPTALWLILEKATTQDPLEGYQDATALLEALAATSKESLATKTMPVKTTPEYIASSTGRYRLDIVQKLPEQFVYRNGSIYSRIDNTEMVLVQGGKFNMGSTERASEGPVKEVHLDNYLIDKYPVTNEQYQRFLEYVQQSGDHSTHHPQEPRNHDHIPKGWKTYDYRKYSDTVNSPVIFVNWWDAWAYASWAGKTLPTEAQWEKAARGTLSHQYPWGNQDPNPDLANFGNNLGKTTPVGSYPKGASCYGCEDMAGNVWEWCLDSYDKSFYQNSENKNPLNSNDSSSRTLRGGSWNDSYASIRASCRGCWVNIVRYSYIGFRCVYPLDDF